MCEEAEYQAALTQAVAVWDPKKMQERLKTVQATLDGRTPADFNPRDFEELRAAILNQHS